MTVTAPADEDFTPGGDQPVRAYLEGQVAHVGRLGMLGEQKAMDVPFNVIGFTAKMIQDQQAKTIADVVRNDAGVQNVKGYSNFVKSYRIRGFLLKPWQSISLYANHTEALQPGSVAPRNDSVTNLGAITGIAHSKQNEVGGRVILAGSAARCRCLKLKKTSRMIGADGAYGMNGEQRHREIETNVFGEPVLGFLLNASAT